MAGELAWELEEILDLLLATAQERWRGFNGHHLVANVLDGVKFKDGIRVTDDDNHDDGMTGEKVAA